MARVELRGVTKVFFDRRDEAVRALDDVSVNISTGELLAVVGPSGSGKTTLVRIIAGLERPSEGTITLNGNVANDALPHERDVALILQDPGLLPHLTVGENVSLGLRLRGGSATEIERDVAKAAERLGITKLLTRLPQELSGGERQRAALARALVRRPKAFLFDEPFSNLDAPARARLRDLLARVHRELRATMIYVTHDQEEAMSLGQRVAVLRDGALQQIADPPTLYRAPANAFVASFIGSPPMNLFRGNVSRRGAEFIFSEHNAAGVAANGMRLRAPIEAKIGSRLAAFAEGNVLLGVRAENIHVTQSASCHVMAEIELAEYLGAQTVLHCNTGATQFRVRVAADSPYRAGEKIPLSLDFAQVVFFNPVSEKIIAM